jgi:UDP-N-acetylglucosamine 2-epimerase (non-hydrolysing)
MMITVVYVFGTRPELIKMIPLILESKKNPLIKTIVCSTGQHKDMLQSLYNFFDLKPDIDFQLMKPNQNLSSLHAETMIRMLDVISEFKPDWIIVQGDTTSAHAAAMAAFYQKVKVGHVEAGLRTFDIHSPFPEEMNRRAIGLIARAHFCPTIEAEKNILNERVDASSFVEVTGNTGIDTLHLVDELFEKNDKLAFAYAKNFSFLNLDRFILATQHRRENFGEPQENILKALMTVAKDHQIDILFPVHPNPNVRRAVEQILQPKNNPHINWVQADSDVQKSKPGRIFLIEPLDYPALIFAMKKCLFVMTDSGGIQEEAPTFKKEILVLRQSTERPEGVAAGFSKLVGTDYNAIVSGARDILGSQERVQSLGPNPFGDGQASKRIVNSLFNSV